MSEDLGPYRDEMVISTKAGWDMWPGPYGQGGGSRKYLLASLDQSLDAHGPRLRRHLLQPPARRRRRRSRRRWARSTPRCAQGKALYVGISSYDAERTRQAAAILADLGTPLLIHQPSYSMVNRWIETEGLLDAAAELGIGVIGFTALAQGLLTDRYLDGIPEDSRAARGDTFDQTWLNDEMIERLRALNEIAAAPRADARPARARLGAARRARHLAGDRRLVGRAARAERRRARQPRASTDGELAEIDEHRRRRGGRRPLAGGARRGALSRRTPDRPTGRLATSRFYTRRMTLFDEDLPALTGGALPASDFEGRAVLVVNVASKCGLTPQYEGLERLQQRYADRGFTVLGVPSNQFAGQEPGTAEEIQPAAASRFNQTLTH